MPSPTVEPLSPFQRILPPLTVYIPDTNIGDKVIGRVGDLKAQIIPSDLKARLTWTAPDMGGKPVAKYQLKFAHTIGTILDNFDAATTWVHGLPFPLAPGSETTFTLDFTRNPSLLDQTLYFALRCYTEVSENAKAGEVSNWVRVHVPSPPPPPPIPTPSSTIIPFWTQSVEENVVPSLAQTFEIKLELILPVCIGFILLIIAIVTYCIFCFRKKAQKETKKHPEKPLNVSIVPTENGNTNISSPISNGHYDMNNTVPNLPQYEVRVEDDQKRYSVTNYDTNGYGVTTQTNGNLSVISEYENRQNTLTREKTLSPYQSWSASQLLHEHERRTSPYGQVGEDYSGYYPPPVPPLPAYQQEYPPQNIHLPPPNQFMSYPPNQPIYNQTLQGSVTSVNSSKLRNVTMV